MSRLARPRGRRPAVLVRLLPLLDEADILDRNQHLDEDLGLLHALKPHARVLATVPNFDSASHLRFFASEREVLERYGEAVTDNAITSFSLSAASVIYLLDGFIPQSKRA